MLPLLHLIWVWTANLTVLVCGSLAIWRGGWAERSTAVVIWVAWFITPVLQKQNHDPGVMTTILDGAVTAFVFAVSYYSRRIWTVFMTAFMFGTFLTHLTADVMPGVGYFAYVTTMGLFGGYGVALTLGGAALEAEYLRKTPKIHA
ncbi:hypothetical protein ATDW_10550 [Asticcacaulis sp. DW145]|uniref:Uncharacterized protein n=1 Tax=Asticcacaulis currens TaxID=2984210 RepID=A0ABT5IDU3_9CAUL|nr:hypothetical protein [Asticcacaulis currens]MDC7694355.1 hypothetical protein [Asticcacaulis currens]BEV10559.1 hypothetical protein ATDW_10550 [Asticcacaulis sp. DW145]